MRILLHICCGPCSTYVVEHLRSLGHCVVGYFFNPNIAPQPEYEMRLLAAKAYCQSVGLELIVDNSITSETWPISLENNATKRCYYCYSLRLDKVAAMASRDGFEAFSTTLLISPFQKHEQIKMAGGSAERKFGLPFYYEDWRPKFKLTYQLAQSAGLYRQNYCGCLSSQAERKFARQKG